jgi:hypothetical protein
MGEAVGARVPEITILQILTTGVNAITADPDLLDEILEGPLDSAELTKVKALWVSNPPTPMQGWARDDSPFPVYALTMGADATRQDYIGVGERAAIDLLMDEATSQVGGFDRRTRSIGTFNIWVWAEHPDVTTYWYRVLKGILNVAIPVFIKNGLDEPSLSGADLMPDPSLAPANLFNRRLTINVEYNEVWSSRSDLAIALNGALDPFVSDPTKIDARLRDSDPFPGKITPIEPTE